MFLLMRGIVGVDERRFGLRVIIIFVIVLLGLSGRVDSDSVSRILTSAWDVISAQDSEAVDARRVLDSVRLAVVPNVAVLSSPLVVADTLLSVDDAVLLGEGRAKLASPGVESLFLQDPEKCSCNINTVKPVTKSSPSEAGVSYLGLGEALGQT